MSPSASPDAMTPQRVARVLWRRKLVCSVVAVVVLAAGTGWFLTRPKVYQSTSSVALLPDTANAGVLPNYPNLIDVRPADLQPGLARSSGGVAALRHIGDGASQ